VYAFIPEVSFSCPLSCCYGKFGWHVRLLPQNKGKKKDEYYAAGGSLVAQGYLDPVEQAQSSAWRELIAIVYLTQFC